MTTITKTAFVADLAETHNMNRQNAQEAVNAVVATLTQTLIDGHGIKLPGLSTFFLKERAGRAGRNPATEESLEIPAKNALFSSRSPERSPTTDPTARMTSCDSNDANRLISLRQPHGNITY